jgi:hypothetical protein
MHDLAVLRDKIFSELYGHSETQDSAETRQIFLQSLDRRRHKLKLDSLQLVRRIYVEKPRQFEHRLAAYWRAWKLNTPSGNTENRKKAGNTDGASNETSEPPKPVKAHPDSARKRSSLRSGSPSDAILCGSGGVKEDHFGVGDGAAEGCFDWSSPDFGGFIFFN